MADTRAFEFFMIFYGLLLGLAVTELFGGFGKLLREKNVPPFGILTPLICTVTLTEIVANFIDAWDRLQNVTISLGDIARPTLIGITYFALAAIVVPHDKADWTDPDRYFLDRRRRFASLLLFGNLLVLIPEIPIIGGDLHRGDYAGVAYYLVGNVFLFGAYLWMFFGRGRRGAIISMVVALGYYVFYYIEAGLFSAPSTA